MPDAPTTSNSNEPVLIHFVTWDTWLAQELADFVSDVATTYRLLLLLRTLVHSAEDSAERASRAQEELLRLGPPPPFLLEWKEWVHWWRKHGRRLPPSSWPNMGPGGWTPDPQPEAEVDYLVRNDDFFIGPTEDLSVHRMEMASPGGFSFMGLGEPIEQLRELIKDLWYRNRLENQRGKLAILEQTLDLFAKHGLSPQQLFAIAVRILDNQKAVRELIESGKLGLEGQERIKESPKRRTRRTKEPPRGST